MGNFITDNIISEGSISGVTISGNTFYGNGSGLTNVSATFSKSWDAGGGFITTGNTRYLISNTTCTINRWSIIATGTNPTCTIDIWKVGTGTSLPTVSNTIMGTKPILSTGNAVRSTITTGWTTLSITEGDIIAFNIDSVSNTLTLTFTLEVA